MMRIFPFPPGIKFTYPYHNYYGSSFYRFMQLELLICTSTSIFKHFLYTNMPYICNAKIGCNFITLFFQHTQLQHFCFQHTQLQHFCPEIPQQCAGYSTSILYKCNPLRAIHSYFSHLWWSHIIILFQPLDLNESSYLGLPQPTKISYLFTWFYIAIWTIFMTELATKC